MKTTTNATDSKKRKKQHWNCTRMLANEAWLLFLLLPSQCSVIPFSALCTVAAGSQKEEEKRRIFYAFILPSTVDSIWTTGSLSSFPFYSLLPLDCRWPENWELSRRKFTATAAVVVTMASDSVIRFSPSLSHLSALLSSEFLLISITI